MVGRPCSRVEINLNDMEKTIRDIKVLLKVASNLEKIKLFSKNLNNVLSDTRNVACQTDVIDEFDENDENDDENDDMMRMILMRMNQW